MYVGSASTEWHHTWKSFVEREVFKDDPKVLEEPRENLGEILLYTLQIFLVSQPCNFKEKQNQAKVPKSKYCQQIV